MKVFYGLAALLVAYAFVTPPFRAPDEFNHFFRAYQVSQGQLLSSRPLPQFVGGMLPRSLWTFAAMVADYPSVPQNALRPGVLTQAHGIPLEPHLKGVFHFPNSASYSPVVFLPAAVGILVGREAGAGPLVLFYLARLANALAAAGLLAYAVSRAGPLRLVFAIVALLPMALFEMGTAGIDAVTFGLIFVWCAEWAALLQPGAVLRPGRLLLLALLLSQARPPYPSLVLLAFALPAKVFPSRGLRMALPAAVTLAAFIPCLGWNLLVWHLQVPMRPGFKTDSLAQLIAVLHHPLHFVVVALATFWEGGWLYPRQVIGIFGWENLPLSGWLCACYAGALAGAVCLVDTSRLALGRLQRVFLLGLAAVGCLFVALFLYMIWNPVGVDRIEGLQGRYFIPFALLTALALANDRLRSLEIRWLPRLALLIAVAVNVGALVFLLRASLA